MCLICAYLPAMSSYLCAMWALLSVDRLLVAYCVLVCYLLAMLLHGWKSGAYGCMDGLLVVISAINLAPLVKRG